MFYFACLSLLLITQAYLEISHNDPQHEAKNGLFKTTAGLNQKNNSEHENSNSQQSLEQSDQGVKTLIQVRKLQSSSWQSIRVLADYSNLNTQSPYTTLIQTRLVPQAIQYIQKAYSVLPKSIISELKGKSICKDLSIPKQHQTAGIQNYDLVIYVGTQNTNGERWLAKAFSCYSDTKTFRPVAGMISFNAFYLSTLNLKNITDALWSSLLQTTIHEITHVLGFSSILFPYFINPSTNVKLGVNNIVKTQNGRNWIILPSVVKYAQQYFNCSSIWGVPLEEYGGSSTAGSHWERTTFGNEAMTGTDFPGAVFSNFTFRLMESTGWYQVNYNYAQKFVWGFGEGCSLGQGTCPSGAVEFCNGQNQACSHDYMGPATCTTTDPYAGGCSYWKEDTDNDCRQNSSRNTQIALNTSGYVGVGSRCWMVKDNSSVSQSSTYAGCFKSECKGGAIYVSVGNSTYLCNKPGQVFPVKFKNRTSSLICPSSYFQFCSFDNPCPGDCNGRGNCIKNVCYCWAGFTGTDCSKQA